MNKKFFDLRLYRDACRQLKVIGSAAMILLMLEAVLIPLYYVIVEGPVRNSGYPVNRDLWSLHPMAVLVFVVAVPAMTLYLFRFLNNRRDSDFYHSMPQTRVCVAVSFLAAVLTWAAVLQWGTTLVSLALNLILPIGSRVLLDSVLLQSLSISILSILVAGGILLSMSITGNTFSNIMVTGLILWAPRLIMLAVQVSIGSSLSIISQDKYLPFLGNGFNLLTGSTFSLLTGSDAAELFTAAVPMGYTLVLGLIYCGLGILLFHRRASESAGNASVHPGLQTAIRLLPAFLFALVPNVILYSDLAGDVEFRGEECFNLFILYLVSVIIYFLYELISTRKVANLRRAIPGLAILLGMNVLVVAGMLGMRHSLLSFSPSGEEIVSIRMPAETAYLTMNVETGAIADARYDGYFTGRLAEVEITDPEVRDMVAERLQAAVDQERGGTEVGYTVRKDITIRTGRRTAVRRIGFTNQDLQQLAEALKQDPAAEDIYMNLPQQGDPNLKVLIQDYRITIRPEQAMEVYQALQEDAREMGFVRWFAYLSGDYSVVDLADSQFSSVNAAGNLYLVYSDHTHNTASSIPISNVTPRALKAYRAVQLENQRGSEQVEKGIRAIERLMTAEEEQWDMSPIRIYGDRTERDGLWIGDVSVDGSAMDRSDMEEACQLVLDLYRQQEEISYEETVGFLDLSLFIEILLDRQGELAGSYETIYSGENLEVPMLLAVPEDCDVSILTHADSAS